MELINEPSLNINGMSSGDVGALARNVIPTTATAVLDLRLVKGNDHRRQVARLIDHIRKEGFHVIDRDPTSEERLRHPLIARVTMRAGGYNAERTAMDLPVALAVVAAVQSTSDRAFAARESQLRSQRVIVLRRFGNRATFTFAERCRVVVPAGDLYAA